jgi:1-acyl-sn-glycerol-3-phosphate acyltransferase
MTHARARLSTTVRLVKLLLRRPLMVLTKRDWRGAENLPVDGGFVLAANHVSHLDPIMLSHWMLDHGVSPHFLAKEGLFRVKPLVGRVVGSAEQIPVYRRSDRARDAFDAAVDAVERGWVVSFYPEGTITRDPDLWPMTGHTGAVRVALRTGAPLVPVAQWGPQDVLWPYTKRPRFFPRRTYRVLAGPPVDLSDLAGRPLEESVLREGTQRLMAAITDQLAELRGERPTRPPIDAHSVGDQHRRSA